MLLHKPENEQTIDTVWVFVGVDDKGLEGILAHAIPGLGVTPLVTGLERQVPWMKQIAAAAGKLANRRVKVLKFTRREVVEVLEP
jgi:hypothetical protein